MEPRGFGPLQTLGTLGSDTRQDSIKKLTFGKGSGSGRRSERAADRTGPPIGSGCRSDGAARDQRLGSELPERR